MNSTQIRNTFLDFFAQKGHKIVPSAPLVIKNDPTLMFTNAGMNQFKDYFLGNQVPEVKRVADTQKCLRVSGKHNDLEDVGLDTYHHTLFEMLGNWSFGDYFKKEAIEWAWELLTEVYKLPKERLYVTVFEGDAKENLDFDFEAESEWAKYVSKDKILKGNKKDNFWEMGEVGPCGPCSEIHIDLRNEAEIAQKSGKELVNDSHPQVIEIWNLVFIQYNRMANGSLSPLPAKHVDTGMGFERLVRAIHAKNSNYDTDVFLDTIALIESKTGKKYGKDEQTDIAMRVLSDHLRAVGFAIGDGLLPSNNKAGYVIRRILRRAVRYYYSFLGVKEPLLCELIETMASKFSDIFPELNSQKEFIKKVIFEEEVSFLRTLELGLKKLDNLIQSASLQKVISGKDCFELYDTFGFPLDLTALILREKSWDIDEKGFDEEMQKQKDRSRLASEKEAQDWVILSTEEQTFVGYDQLEIETKILKYRKAKNKDGQFWEIVLHKNPFYAESGGQIGDTGILQTINDKILIFDTKKENELAICFAKNLPEDCSKSFTAQVNAEKRNLTQANHSSTHLLQSALKQVLGNHIAQKGSYVSEEILRFDFSHFTKLTDLEIKQVETIVNQKIREGISLIEHRDTPIKKATEMGATALFGEKYGDFVRVIVFDPAFSMELCGGTHIANTSQIGSFRIVGESSVAAGVRRIEAITSSGADQFIDDKLNLLDEIAFKLKSPKDTLKAIDKLLEEKSILEDKLKVFRNLQKNKLKQELNSKINTKNDISFIFEVIEIDNLELLKDLSFELKNEHPNIVIGLASVIDEKPVISLILSDLAMQKTGNHARNIIKEAAKHIDGGGGGQAFYATAGGKKASNIDKALAEMKAKFL